MSEPPSEPPTEPSSESVGVEVGVEVRDLDRPDSNLLTYYALFSLLFGPFFPIAFGYFYFRYRTLRYQFDDEGVSMRWGALFRREISLTYARIQDIHLVSNFVERRLGLARLHVQTAAGASSAEMTIEGLREFEAVRDFLYERMRRRRRSGTRADGELAADLAADVGAPGEVGDLAPVVEALRETARELRLLREELMTKREVDR